MSDEEPDSVDDVFLQCVVSLDEATGLKELHLCVGGPEPSRVRDAMVHGFREALQRHLDSSDFGGTIKVVVLSEVTPQTPQLWAMIASTEQELRHVISTRRLRTAGGQPVTLEVVYT